MITVYLVSEIVFSFKVISLSSSEKKFPNHSVHINLNR